ncbi:phosphoribosylaminoimidazolecarboxamide formyltransferase [Mycobacterium intracellulare]|uniref:Bifunctional phosphoribosylaminoimidazolecarboxamide formyltransferase/IMP cyclohydrolase n=1 Tax=Mycobacterium intracellulare subsp. chimaera TaxID=222805 RepID=A0A7U5RYH0_MYCIT|nr:phosphoribosylaminoimidazolecarboxamide formyltransferase [Mycobacterium intracellulare]ASL18377.1 bifunctional phosphoribosylaminoimidazolecarboxamide formyltransferase/IMP cyclohydrolase [Mycobacterium intracellulare subsp. chimaera]
MDLRYGMNPHQSARILSAADDPVRVLHGSPSMINLLDALNAWQLVREAAAATDSPAATSFKHVSPAGVAIAGEVDATMRQTWSLGEGVIGSLTSAYVRARDADPKSSFGDMIAVSEPVDEELADLLARVVSDGIIAPGFHPGTMQAVTRKKGGKFLVLQADPGYQPPQWECRDVYGVRLEQQRDQLPLTADLLQVINGPALNHRQIHDALLGMVTMRYTQSNSVAYVKDGMTVGIGAGQQSRVDCTKLAGRKSTVWWRRRYPPVQGLPLASATARQDRLNWQIRIAENDMTSAQRATLTALTGRNDLGIDAERWTDWDTGLTGITMVSDGYIPFRDNIDHASSYGVTSIVEPGGSSRTDEIHDACEELGITLAHTNTRLFHH